MIDIEYFEKCEEMTSFITELCQEYLDIVEPETHTYMCWQFERIGKGVLIHYTFDGIGDIPEFNYIKVDFQTLVDYYNNKITN